MTRYELSDSRLSVANLCLRQFACYCDSDGKRTPGNCYSVGSGSILAYGVFDAGYRYDLTDKEASDLGDPSTIPAFEGITCIPKRFQILYV